jgi:hypothetical protein
MCVTVRSTSSMSSAFQRSRMLLEVLLHAPRSCTPRRASACTARSCGTRRRPLRCVRLAGASLFFTASQPLPCPGFWPWRSSCSLAVLLAAAFLRFAQPWRCVPLFFAGALLFCGGFFGAALVGMSALPDVLRALDGARPPESGARPRFRGAEKLPELARAHQKKYPAGRTGLFALSMPSIQVDFTADAVKATGSGFLPGRGRPRTRRCARGTGRHGAGR